MSFYHFCAWLEEKSNFLLDKLVHFLMDWVDYCNFFMKNDRKHLHKNVHGLTKQFNCKFPGWNILFASQQPGQDTKVVFAKQWKSSIESDNKRLIKAKKKVINQNFVLFPCIFCPFCWKYHFFLLAVKSLNGNRGKKLTALKCLLPWRWFITQWRMTRQKTCLSPPPPPFQNFLIILNLINTAMINSPSKVCRKH